MAFQLDAEAGNWRREIDDQTGLFRTTIYVTPRFGANRTRLDSGALVVDHPRIRARGDQGFLSLRDQSDVEIAVRSFSVERFRGGSWIAEELDPTTIVENERAWDWGLLKVALDANGKFTYHLTPGQGTFRLVSTLRPSRRIAPTLSRHTRGGRPFGASWEGLRTNWRDIFGSIAEVEIAGADVTWRTIGFDLANRETLTLDPTDTFTAGYSAEVASDGFRTTGGGDNVGADGSSFNTRVGQRIDINGLPADDTVTQVDYECEVLSVSSADSYTYAIGPYNGDGQGDPEADSGSDMYARCDVSGDNYVAGDTTLRTTGIKTFSNLGSQANTDVENARDAGTKFSMAIMEESNTTVGNTGSNIADFDDTNDPRIVVTHDAGGATGTGGLTVQASTLSASGIQEHIGSGILSVLAADMAASGVMQPKGVGTLEATEAELASSGVQKFLGTSDLAVQEATMEAIGNQTDAPTGVGDLIAQENVMAAQGAQEHIGVTVLLAEDGILSSQGEQPYEGFAIVEAQVIEAVAQGAQEHIGSSALTAEVAILLSQGFSRPEGTGLIELAEGVLEAQGIQEYVGSGDLTLAEAVMEALGQTGFAQGTGSPEIASLVLAGQAVMLPEGVGVLNAGDILLVSTGQQEYISIVDLLISQGTLSSQAEERQVGLADVTISKADIATIGVESFPGVTAFVLQETDLEAIGNATSVAPDGQGDLVLLPVSLEVVGRRTGKAATQVYIALSRNKLVSPEVRAALYIAEARSKVFKALSKD